MGKGKMVNICLTGHFKWQFLFCVEQPTRLTVGSLGLQVFFAAIFIPRSTGCRVGSWPPQAPAPTGSWTGLGSAGWSSVSLFSLYGSRKGAVEKNLGQTIQGRCQQMVGRLDSQQTDCQGPREPESRQLPSALEKEARQAGRAGQRLRQKGARTLPPGTG